MRIKFRKDIRNRITIIPITDDEEEYKRQQGLVHKFLRGAEEGKLKDFSLTKVIPMPEGLVKGSVEEDNWLLRNWGTRRTASNTCILPEGSVLFDTEYRPVVKVVEVLAKAFPTIDFIYEYSSSHPGEYVGASYVSQGEIIPIERFEAFSKEAYDVSFELFPHTKMLYYWNNIRGRYEYDRSDFEDSIKRMGSYMDSDGSMLRRAVIYR